MINYDVIIIGAGQAGLSMGYFLRKTSLSFLILDRLSDVGEVWKKRYNSLTLFTPRNYSSLPGLKLVGNQQEFPTKNEIADYLSNYTNHFSLPIQMDTEVLKLSQLNNGYEVKTTKGVLVAKKVIIATGPFQDPYVPKFSQLLSEDVIQIHSSQYKDPTQLSDGLTLVVGAGNSGMQIAAEISKIRTVYLSVGEKIKFFPEKIGHHSIFWWLDHLGLYQFKVDSLIGKFLKNQQDPVIGLQYKSLIKNNRILLKSRTISVEKDTITFADDSNITIRNVIWSTGYRANYHWIDIPMIKDVEGLPIHKRGITPIDGVYFLGLPWQSTRGSSLLSGVGSDAEYLYQHIIGKSIKITI